MFVPGISLEYHEGIGVSKIISSSLIALYDNKVLGSAIVLFGRESSEVLISELLLLSLRLRATVAEISLSGSLYN